MTLEELLKPNADSYVAKTVTTLAMRLFQRLAFDKKQPFLNSATVSAQSINLGIECLCSQRTNKNNDKNKDNYLHTSTQFTFCPPC
jgi:hypothetical protein